MLLLSPMLLENLQFYTMAKQINPDFYFLICEVDFMYYHAWKAMNYPHFGTLEDGSGVQTPSCLLTMGYLDEMCPRKNCPC